MKLVPFLVILAMWISIPLQAQFSDDFSDGNLDGWEGDVSNFIVNAANQLQLNAPSGSTQSWIHTPVAFADSMVWEFYFKLDFAPSTSNILRIYLGTDGIDLATASGYFLEIGSSGDTDPLQLKYLDNGSAVDIAQSVDGLVALQPVELTLRVVKKDDGTWEVYKLGEVVPELLFSANHNLLPLSSLNTFGFYGKYTDTRRDKYYFDNITIETPQADVTAPTLVSLEVIDAFTVLLTFDEPIESGSANLASHYLLLPPSINPVNISLNANQITLTFANPFVSLQSYTLSISGLTDVAGNVMTAVQQPFTFTQVDVALPNELLITEIMADPTPVVGLPDAEYLEIYNSSSKVFRLSDYTLTVGASQRSLPDELLQPGQFVILTDAGFADALGAFGNVAEINGMPSLTNNGTYLAIKNLSGSVIDELTYSLSWYKDSAKQNGGWSLELINPFHLCAGESNWSAAANLLGGTPGTQNSQWQTTPDTGGPELVSIYAASPTSLELRFDEQLDEVLMADPSAYQINPSIEISAVEILNGSTVVLSLNTPLQAGVGYTLNPFDAFDCLGNSRNLNGPLAFGLIVDAEPGDLYINEVLFNPFSGGSRFLEMINKSDKYINLKSLVIARLTTTDQDLYPTGLEEVLAPGEIVAFSPNPQDILSRYTVPFPENLFSASLPSWDEDVDNVSILVNGIVIDSFTYSSDWHHPVIADQNGVSLERVSINAATTNSSNWHSASSLSGYATPTGENSQRFAGGTPNDLPFTIDNRQFTPNDDGYKDFLALQFDQARGDDVASVWIYDREGREVRNLVSNELIGASSLITWDGSTAEGNLADMGIYIVFVRLWNPDGAVHEYQESVALIKR